MKGIILAALLAATTAQAGTITLGSETCTPTNVCFQVPNDAGVTIDYISNATQYRRLLVSIDGELYDSGLWAVYGPETNLVLYAANGTAITVALSWTIVQNPCVRLGRGASCPRTVTLNGGTITQ